jgi:sigma-B regulation protein RsbU (phosphoserine phosphatase)
MRKTTILRQLLLNITIPVVLVLFAFSYTNYRYNKVELESQLEQEFKQITEEVKNLVEMHDYALKVNELHYESKLKEISEILVQKFDKELNPVTTNLYELSLEIGLDTNKESIYIIDTNGVVVNTSFYKDLHLDFYKRGIGYREYFEKIWAKKGFVTDRFSTEQATGRIKKWSFIPTKNNQYLIELGFLSDEARKLKQMMHDKVDQIPLKHKSILSVNTFMQVKGEKIKEIDDSVLHAKMERVLLDKKSERIITEEEGRTVFEDLIFLPAYLEETSMFSAIVLYIKSDDKKSREILNSAIIRFIFMALIAIILLLVVISLRARTITRPIKRLSEKTELISSGKLNERIEVEGKNEIAQLSRNFNQMVEHLQESYETLEQKVKDRTAQVVLQKDIIEEKHKEITDSINYAERIQRTFLSTKETLDGFLGEYFILFKPKDVVSGDFYWTERLSTNDFVLVAADSTGHGVPGAIMSLLNITCLENSVKEGFTEPDEILNHTRINIIERLKKDGSHDGGKDGMDCSLLCFNSTKTKVKFALANNPLWLVRDGQLQEFSPDKMPVGKHDKQHVPFTRHEINLQKNDVIYVFTDGYADQFGGPKGKKFKYSNLQKILVENSNLAMTELHTKLKNEFEEWKADLEQIDDVCVIGIRI